MSKLANILLGMSKKVAKARSRITTYTIKNGKIISKYEKANNIESKAFDTSQYQNSQIFLEDYANPIKITSEEINGEIEEKLIPSTRYRNFMKQNAIEQMFFSEPLEMKKIIFLIIGNIVVSIIVLFVIVGLVG